MQMPVLYGPLSEGARVPADRCARRHFRPHLGIARTASRRRAIAPRGWSRCMARCFAGHGSTSVESRSP